MSFCILPQVGCSRDASEKGDDVDFINTSLRDYWATLAPQLGPSPYGTISGDKPPNFFKLVEILKVFPALLRPPVVLYSDCSAAVDAVQHVTGSMPDVVAEPRLANIAVYCQTAVGEAPPPKHKGMCIVLIPSQDQYRYSTAAGVYNFCATYEKTTLYSPVMRGGEEVVLVGSRCLHPLFSEKGESSNIPLFFFTKLSEALIILGQSGLEAARSESVGSEEWKLKYYHD